MNKNRILGRRLAYSSLCCLALLSLIFQLSGCISAPVIAAQTPSPLGDWITNFLSSPVCAPPCWENIIPGKITMDEAIQLVKTRKDVVKFRGPILPPPLGNQIDFGFIFDEGVEGTISSDSTGKFVSTIYLFLHQSVSLNQLTKSYGEPEQVLIWDISTPFRRELNFIYGQNGMVLICGGDELFGKIEISPETGGATFYFFTQEGLKDYIKRKGGARYSDFLVDWHGFGSYADPKH